MPRPRPRDTFVAYALLLMSTYSNGSVEDRQAVAVCEFLVQFYTIVKTEGTLSSDDMRAEIKKFGRNINVLYSALAVKALAACQKIWKVTPKLNLFVHLWEWQVEGGNPRAWWTCSDDYLMGVMSEVSASVHAETCSVFVHV